MNKIIRKSIRLSLSSNLTKQPCFTFANSTPSPLLSNYPTIARLSNKAPSYEFGPFLLAALVGAGILVASTVEVPTDILSEKENNRFYRLTNQQFRSLGERMTEIIKEDYSDDIVDLKGCKRAQIQSEAFLKTILSLDQFNHLKNYEPKQVLALDTDAAIFRILPNGYVIVSRVDLKENVNAF